MAVTDLTLAQATAAGYALATLSNQGGAVVVTLKKTLNGQTGKPPFVLEAKGIHATSLTTAETLVVNSLNAIRRHRYAGSPGAASGSTVAAWPNGQTPTVDTD